MVLRCLQIQAHPRETRRRRPLALSYDRDPHFPVSFHSQGTGEGEPLEVLFHAPTSLWCAP